MAGKPLRRLDGDAGNPGGARRADERAPRFSGQTSRGADGIDGTARGSGNVELSVPADALQHRVVVSAAGHTPTSRLVRFQGVQYLEFQLTPEPTPPSPTTERAPAEDDERDAKRDDEKNPRGVAGRFRLRLLPPYRHRRQARPAKAVTPNPTLPARPRTTSRTA